MAFTPRLTPEGIYGSRYYYGENPFEASGFGLPNCTAYAWGRFYEVSGVKPTHLPLSDGGKWYGDAVSSGYYTLGQKPLLGSVICYASTTGGAGHVAIVEQINADGSFVISQSGYNRPIAEYPPDTKEYFWTSTCDGTTMLPVGSTKYAFQGFIYNPYVVNTPSASEWISKNAYLTQSEMEHNATLVWRYFGSRGWTIEAVSAMLGNMQSESTINPGIWESFIVGGGGYGLVQWTPHNKYSEWAGQGWQNNGTKECERIEYEKDNGLQWFENPDVTPSNPPISFKEFSTSTLPVGTLANYFLWYYEHPRDPIQPNRAEQAEKWYKFLTGVDPQPPDVPTPSVRRRRGLGRNKWNYLITHLH